MFFLGCNFVSGLLYIPKPNSPLYLRPLWLHQCMWSNPKPATNLRQACRPLSAL